MFQSYGEGVAMLSEGYFDDDFSCSLDVPNLGYYLVVFVGW